MRTKYLLILIISFVFISCKKEKQYNPPTSVPPVHVPPVLLKEVTIPLLPSPYYHIEYHTAGRATFISFASGFRMYDVVYSSGRISEMRSNSVDDKDRLQYSYHNAGRVSNINYADSNGIVYTKIMLTYDGEKLNKLERERKAANGFLVDKTMTFFYSGDGNFREVIENRPPFNGAPELSSIDQFEQYDNKLYVDGFDLLHNEFFDHLVYLPGVVLQKNNPGKITHTGTDINYVISYSYIYNDKNAPLQKIGTGTWLSGSKIGQSFDSDFFFSY